MRKLTLTDRRGNMKTNRQNKQFVTSSFLTRFYLIAIKISEQKETIYASELYRKFDNKQLWPIVQKEYDMEKK